MNTEKVKENVDMMLKADVNIMEIIETLKILKEVFEDCKKMKLKRGNTETPKYENGNAVVELLIDINECTKDMIEELFKIKVEEMKTSGQKYEKGEMSFHQLKTFLYYALVVEISSIFKNETQVKTLFDSYVETVTEIEGYLIGSDIIAANEEEMMDCRNQLQKLSNKRKLQNSVTKKPNKNCVAMGEFATI